MHPVRVLERVPMDKGGQLYPDKSASGTTATFTEERQQEEVGSSIGGRNALTFKRIYIRLAFIFY